MGVVEGTLFEYMLLGVNRLCLGFLAGFGVLLQLFQPVLAHSAICPSGVPSEPHNPSEPSLKAAANPELIWAETRIAYSFSGEQASRLHTQVYSKSSLYEQTTPEVVEINDTVAKAVGNVRGMGLRPRFLHGSCSLCFCSMYIFW